MSYLMLRSLKQARYAVDPLGHFALAFDQYTHFTSPIRRYPDLIVHRVLKWALEHPHAGPGSADPYSRGELAAIALESSETERRAEAAERELIEWKTAQFMEQHLGEEYDALIISVQKFGFFVELMEIFVEGLVPMNRLEEEAGEHCFYRDRDHAIVAGRGSRARIWKLGQRVRVRADRIDPYGAAWNLRLRRERVCSSTRGGVTKRPSVRINHKMIRNRSATLLLLAFCVLLSSLILRAADIVSFQSGNLTLYGVLYKPEGAGPFPAVLYNHGSAAGMLNNEAFEALGPVFAKRGWEPLLRRTGVAKGSAPQRVSTLETRSRLLERRAVCVQPRRPWSGCSRLTNSMTSLRHSRGCEKGDLFRPAVSLWRGIRLEGSKPY